MTKQPHIAQERARALRQACVIAAGLVLETPYDPAKPRRGTAYVGYDQLARLNAALVVAGFDMDKGRANYDRLGERRKDKERAIEQHAKAAREARAMQWEK